MTRLGVPVFALFLVLFQSFMAHRLSIYGAVPQVTIIFAVFWALWAPRRDSFRFAAALGIGLDILGPTPLGFSAAAYGMASLGAWRLGTWMNRDSHAVRFMLIFAASLFAGTLNLWAASLDGAGFGFREWAADAVWASAYTAALGMVFCHAASFMPFFRGIRPVGCMPSDA